MSHIGHASHATIAVNEGRGGGGVGAHSVLSLIFCGTTCGVHRSFLLPTDFFRAGSLLLVPESLLPHRSSLRTREAGDAEHFR